MKRFGDREKRRESIRDAIRKYLERLWHRGKPEQPEDPNSYVTAPKRPRPSSRGAAAVADLPEE